MMLSVFADESGTMPKSDGDEIFVGAAFAIPSSRDVGKLPRRRSNLDWTLRLLRQLGARPSCLYLRPYPGFGDAVDRRYDILSAMALVARQRTGSKFEAADYRAVVWNVTPMVTERPNGPHMDQWEHEHGLVVPR
jgi:hypothetical protein